MHSPNTQQKSSTTQFFRHETVRRINFDSCHILNSITKTNIGPFGSVKLLETDDGELHLVKDGGEFIRSIQIIHPTAIFIGRAALSQKKSHYDGVCSLICFIDSLLEQSEHKILDGIHPRIIVKGIEEARDHALKILDELSIPLPTSRSDLKDIITSATITKSPIQLSDVILDAVTCVHENDVPIDLDRIEVLKIKSTQSAVRLVKGLVIDQGFRHELMAKRMKNVTILLLNVSLELENTAVSTYIPVANSDQRERMTIAERKFVDEKLKQIIELRSLFDGDFLLVNGKGIDGPSLDILSHANISALRRVSRKTMNRLVYSCGCHMINCIDDINPNFLGYAGSVIEEDFKGTKYVFIDEVKDPKAVTIVVSGTTEYNLKMTETAIRSGICSMKNAYNDKKVLPGAGAIEVALNVKLNNLIKELTSKNRIGYQVFAEAVLAIPKALIDNAGLDSVNIINEMLSEMERGELSGVDLETGEVIDPTIFGIYDNYGVVRNIIQAAPIIASQLLLVDEIMQSDREKKDKKEKEK
ncbi:T-complex protein 1 subunit zeta 1 [Histomonas meleagridis]|uniref:T-complex protein 1 subunit zeta 1 n=1 Tax=Histomonas meleagridis TaxID=135588 RepID=UPI0035594084|nr:T-complex protein 1 subunit zeta 1 [Histomonas meleagridis]KAH0802083.1 T-complex protein 1 subunit zeta 1 [Histomonas meleagridis]